MKIGDVVEIVNLEGIENLFEIGELVTIIHVEDEDYPGVFRYKSYDKKGRDWWLSDKNIKLVKSKLEETEEFFNFLHSNMENTYRKEMFDKLYKQFKQERNENAS